MSYMPNAREKKLKPLYPNTKGGKEMASNNPENEYWEGYLTEKDANFVVGYDYHTEAMMAMMDNLSAYENVLKLAGLNPSEVDTKVLDEDRNLDEYSETEISAMSTTTKVFKALQCIILDYAEGERNNVIISMIDDMNDDEYFDAKAKANSGVKNALLRSYEE